MPTPPLPSRDDDEHGAMPADCRVETLADWIIDAARHGGLALSMPASPGTTAIARAVRALVEHEVGAMAESWKQAVLDQVLLARDGDGLTDDHPANEPLFKVLESMGFDHIGDPIGGAS